MRKCRETFFRDLFVFKETTKRSLFISKKKEKQAKLYFKIIYLSEGCLGPKVSFKEGSFVIHVL